jgi:phasin family protein
MARTRTTRAAAAGEGAESAHPARPSVAPTGAAAIASSESDVDVTNFAAMAQANAALMEGLEAIHAAVCAYARDSFGSVTNAARSLIDARSLVDVVSLHHDFTQAALEGLIANSARVAEIGVRATSEALKPLGAHVADTVSKLNRPTKP